MVLLCTHSNSSTSFLETPGLGTVLQVWLHKGKAKGDNLLLLSGATPPVVQLRILFTFQTGLFPAFHPPEHQVLLLRAAVFGKPLILHQALIRINFETLTCFSSSLRIVKVTLEPGMQQWGCAVMEQMELLVDGAASVAT